MGKRLENPGSSSDPCGVGWGEREYGAIGCGEDYFAGKTLTADSNYHSPQNLKKCEEEGWMRISG